MKFLFQNCKTKLRTGIIIVSIVILVAGCASPTVSPAVPVTIIPDSSAKPTFELMETPEKTEVFSPVATFTPADSFPSVWEMLDEANLDRALMDLRMLTGEEPICTDGECYSIKNRKTGSEGLKYAKNYISQELVRLGYAVEREDWSRSNYADQNLIARKSGGVQPEEEVYFVAHLDGVDKFLGERFPAADDNASGVVDLLELARVLKDYTFSRTIVLLFSTGEEQDTLGVRSYIEQLSPDELSSIQYVIDVDMIGYDANRDGVIELWHGNHAPSIALVHQISETIQTYQLDLVPNFVVGCG